MEEFSIQFVSSTTCLWTSFNAQCTLEHTKRNEQSRDAKHVMVSNIMRTLLQTIENLHMTMLLCYAHTYAPMWLWMKTDSKNWKKFWKLSKSLNFLNVNWDLWTIWKSGRRESSQFSSLLSSEASLYVKQEKEKHFHVKGRSFIHPFKSKEAFSIWAKWLQNF